MHSPCDAYPSFRLKAYISGGKSTPQICHITISRLFPQTLYSLYLVPVLILHYGRSSVCTVRVMSEMLTPLFRLKAYKSGGVN